MLLSIIGIFKTKQNTSMLIKQAKAGDEEVQSDLLFAHTQFMKKTASFICKRPIDEHDEEYSVAMNGFHEAMLAFDETENASFHTFAHLIIKRRLIDHIRKESNRNEKELLIKEESATSHSSYLFDEQSLMSHSEQERALARKEELEQYNHLLSNFNLSFPELAKAAPKHKDARKTAFQIAQIVAESDELYTYLFTNKKLPLKEIEALVDVSRKTLERNRKYIIAVVLLLKSDFIYIKDYVKGEII